MKIHRLSGIDILDTNFLPWLQKQCDFFLRYDAKKVYLSRYNFFSLFFQINECLGSVWELHEYKLMAQQSKTESLKEALKAADEEISHQKSLNTQLEIEVCNLY